MARRGSTTLAESISEEINEVLDSDTSRLSPRSTTSPRYARNSLGVDAPTPRHGSIAGIGVGVTSPTSNQRKKKLDPSDPSTWTSAATTSPTDMRPRSQSETQTMNIPAITFDGSSESKPTTESNPTTETGHERERSGPIATALSEKLQNIALTSSKPRSRSPSIEKKSVAGPSTHSQITKSPPRHLASPVGDHRRISKSSAMSTDSEAIGALVDDEHGHEEALQSSDDEKSTSDDEKDSPVMERGRKRDWNREEAAKDNTEVNGGQEIQVKPEIRGKLTSTGRNTLTLSVDEVDDAKPEHHIEHSGKLSETTGPVVPRSNYRSTSPALSAVGNDDDELRRAKAMEVRVSELDEKVKDRTVKLILRGDWAAFQDHEQEDQSNRHEPRFYLVCSDLSNEASYALEWTVGTLLKDGDTILILNANEDENASKHKDVDEPSMEVRMESAKSAEETNNTLAVLTRQTTNQEGKRLTKSALGVGQHQRSASAQARPRTKKDEEREKSIDKLEADFMRYIRKTALQVRCMFEVIQCRSPRHLVLNAVRCWSYLMQCTDLSRLMHLSQLLLLLVQEGSQVSKVSCSGRSQIILFRNHQYQSWSLEND